MRLNVTAIRDEWGGDTVVTGGVNERFNKVTLRETVQRVRCSRLSWTEVQRRLPGDTW